MGRRRPMRSVGMIVCAVGAGIVLAVLVPIWGWLFIGGCAIIGIGWFIMNKFC